jgi:hypothetical protein
MRDFSEMTKIRILIFKDNQSCIRMLGRHRSTQHTKHVEHKYHFIHNLKNGDKLDVKYCPSDQMITELLINPLKEVNQRKCVKGTGLINDC